MRLSIDMVCGRCEGCGVGGKLLKAMQSFFVDRACVWVGNDVSD